MVGFAVAWVVAVVLKIDGKGKREAFVFTSGIFNYGYFAIPVCDAVFGSSFVGKLLVFNLGVEIAIWGVGVILLGGGAMGFARLLNPPILALVAALLCFISCNNASPVAICSVTFLFAVMISCMGTHKK